METETTGKSRLLAFSNQYVSFLWPFCRVACVYLMFIVNILQCPTVILWLCTALNAAVQSKTWSYASLWLSPQSPKRHISCPSSLFILSFCHPLPHFSHSHLLLFSFSFFYLRLTWFHAQPAKKPCFSRSRPRLWRSAGIMWGGTSCEQKATWAVVSVESVKILTAWSLNREGPHFWFCQPF